MLSNMSKNYRLYEIQIELLNSFGFTKHLHL